MNRSSLRLRLLALCFTMVCSGLAQECDWDLSVAPDQGLDLGAPGIKMLSLTRVASTPESCKAACCDEPECDLALVGYPADGEPQCTLVSCMSSGEDACVLQPSSQFKAYRRSEKTKAADSGKKLHIVPLQDSEEPRTDESNNSAVLPDDSAPPQVTTSFVKDEPEDAESPAEPEPVATESANAQETGVAADEYAEYCQVGPQAGPCRAALRHWYYNSETKNCETFIYGGCRGNKNNYISKESCMATCTVSVLPSAKKSSSDADEHKDVPEDAESPAEPEPADTESANTQETEYCQVGPQVGPCRAALRHWYYNSETKNCETFIYGGCRGNKNNYISKESCMAACTVSVLPSAKKSSSDTDEHRDQCMVSPDPGPCRAYFMNFYYDPKSESCRSFIYGGCRGNQNRYGTMEECMARCSGTDSFDGQAKHANRRTPAFFLLITLAAISVVLLVTLVLISMRRRRLFRRASSISDKEELLPGRDEQLSVESLTIPGSPTPHKP
ncbi:hypothetical protein INR49_018564 [Caranx melampygus]|nr:hypothetical protein INR49_018564 [Caranx melampygus]